MRRPTLDDLPEEGIPAGLTLRTFLPDDVRGWANLMTGAIGAWDEDLARRNFLREPGVLPEGIFFLMRGKQFVATATDKQLPLADLGYLHMVAVAPSERGKGLGRSVSLAALHCMRARGCREAILDTDDFRLPAIRTYLALGFVPETAALDHAESWQRILARLLETKAGGSAV